MSDETASGSRPGSWRSQSPGGRAERSWRSRRATQPGDATRRRPWLKGSAAAAGILLVAAGIYLIFAWYPHRRSETAVLVLAKDYDQAACYNGLINPYAGGEFDAFRRLEQAKERPKVARISRPAEIPEHARKGGSLILYLSAVAVNVVERADPSQKADVEIHVVLEDAAKPDDVFDHPGGRNSFPLSEIWTALADPRLADVHKLVLLDLGRLSTDWRMGVLQNRLFDESLLKRDLEAFKKQANGSDKLTVLCAAGPGQTSWTSAQLGQSVFGHFVVEALAGKAPVHVQHVKDHPDFLALSPLLHRVQACTAEWVKQNRGAASPQEPFFDSTERLENLKVDLAWTNPPKADDSRGDLFKSISECWKQRDELRQSPNRFALLLRLDPVRWRQLHEQLMRAEALAYAGENRRAAATLQAARQTLRSLNETSGVSAPTEPGANDLNEAITRQSTRAVVGSVYAARSLPLPAALLAEAAKRMPRHYPGGPPPADKTARAAALRDLAEKAVALPLGAATAVDTLLFEADGQRLEAEDLLFADSSASRRIDELSRAATQTYETAEAIAANLAAARALFEDVLSSLPDLAYWAACGVGDETRRSDLLKLVSQPADWTQSGSRAAIESGLEQLQAQLASAADARSRLEADVLALFWKTRLLSENRREVEGRPNRSVQDSERLKEQARGLESERDRIDAALRATARRAETEEGDTQTSHRQDVVDSLAYALLPADLRASLLKRLVRFDEELFKSGDRSPKGRALGGDTWHALWILQIFSLARAPSELSADIDGAYARWKRLVRSDDPKSPEDARLDAAERRIQSAELGQEIRRSWIGLRQSVEKPMKPSKRTGDVTSRWNELRDADLRARLLHGYDAGELAEDAQNRGGVSRQLCEIELASLCLLQARRSVESFWVAGGREEPSWFADAASSFAQAAAVHGDRAGLPAMPREIDALQKAIAAWEKASKSLEVSIDPKQVRLWSSHAGHSATARLSLEAEDADCRARLAKVRPLIAVKTTDETIAALEDSPSSDGPSFRTGEQGPARLTAARTFEFKRPQADGAPRANCKVLEFAPCAFLRGRVIDASAVLQADPCPPPARIVKYTPLEERAASLTVEGYDRRSVLFILDCSNSMTEKYETGKKVTRFEAAVEALRTTLEQLLKNPVAGHRVGLIAYGHRSRYRSTSALAEKNPKWPSILQGFVPADPGGPPDDAGKDFQYLIALGPLQVNKKQFAELFDWNPTTLAAVPNGQSKLQPFGNTPLVGALEMGWELAKPAGGGPLVDSIVVVTDGGPNDVDWLERLRKLVPKLQEGGVSLHVIEIFNENQANDAIKTNQAKGYKEMVEYYESELKTFKEFESACKDDLKIQPLRAIDPQSLKSRVVDAVSSRREVVVESRRGAKKAALRLADFKEPYRLEPDNYTVYFGEFQKWAFPLPLRGGEAVSLRLTWDRGPGTLVRIAPNIGHPTAKSSAANGTSFDQNDDPRWLGVDSYRVDGATGVAMFVLRFGHGDVDRLVRRPLDVEFQIRPEHDGPGRARRRRIDWKPVGGELPGWEIKLSDWPGPQPAQISAWWKMRPAEPLWRRKWSDLQNSSGKTSIAIPGSSGDRLLIDAASDKRAGEVSVTASLENRGGKQPSDALLGVLDQVRIQLIGRDAADYPFTRETIDADGSATVRFQVGPAFSAEASEVGLSFGPAWRKDAVSLERPISVDRTDVQN